MRKQYEKVHRHAESMKRKWSIGEEYLDTERLRGVAYGTLQLRKESHLYLGHGVAVAVGVLLVFWVVSANWSLLTGWTGIFGKEEERIISYTGVTSVTQLPPPPLIEKPKPPAQPKPKVQPKVEKPPNVGKIKKVKKEEAPPEQTLATQKEIRKAIQQPQGVEGGIGDSQIFTNVDKMPSFIRQRKPRYPSSARRAGIEGKVFVSVLISEKGKPIKAKIMKREPSDQKVFDKSAVEAVMKSTYSPGIQHGRPVKVWLMIPIRFVLR
ncbi:energy transducer TonB [Prosthecochloris sp. SCSIO W1101]|uniref:energy transducer TonB n=1 Tax=Prosthecochloris sp. SCSIO W1101 TaxID=2992242 RepID=UPI00223CD0AD|nr:energy transducer TonB [Prosthecochloris sp. SCSIO W1101]UZJ40738.1 energy transducer TonB [Prosthecochloris sp. SCSIO W1101]